MRWAIEGAAGLGAPLAERLHADDIHVDGRRSWLAVLLLSTGHDRKRDPAQALSVEIAAWASTALRTWRSTTPFRPARADRASR